MPKNEKDKGTSVSQSLKGLRTWVPRLSDYLEQARFVLLFRSSCKVGSGKCADVVADGDCMFIDPW